MQSMTFGACSRSHDPRIAARTGPVHYEFSDTPPRLVEGDDGRDYYFFTLINAAARTEVTMMLRADEVDMIAALKQEPARSLGPRARATKA
jgi:hypothetical protein